MGDPTHDPLHPTHFGLVKSGTLCDDFFEESQRNDYIMFVRGKFEKRQLQDIRSGLKSARPLSSNRCPKDIEESFARRLGAQPIDRPRKKVQYAENGMYPSFPI